MASVLLIGESWFTVTIHQKGFDTFQTAEYTEGASTFIDALGDEGHDVTYVPAHAIAEQVPDTPEDLSQFDVIVISDVGTNSFLLSPATFNRSETTSDKLEAVREYVERGGGLLMVGGYLSFAGIDGKARYGRSALQACLPVDIVDHDDRVEVPQGVVPQVLASHDAVDGLDQRWPALLGYNWLKPKDDSTTVVGVDDDPLLVVGSHGTGRTAAFASDLAPHWAPPGFLDWSQYPTFWSQLVTWLAG